MLSPLKRAYWKGDGPAAVRQDEPDAGEVLEDVGVHQLHEAGVVHVHVVGAGGGERGVARAGAVDHRRHVQLHHLLVERVPVTVAERRVRPVAAGRVRVEVAADETQLVDGALQLLHDAPLRRHAGRLRQRARADEAVRVDVADALDHVVVDLGPVAADELAAEVVAHPGGARREDGNVRAALVLQLQLAVLQRGAYLVVGDVDRVLHRCAHEGDLCGAEYLHPGGRGRIVAMGVDDHLVRCSCANAGDVAARRPAGTFRAASAYYSMSTATCERHEREAA